MTGFSIDNYRFGRMAVPDATVRGLNAIRILVETVPTGEAWKRYNARWLSC